jgi:spore coat polysaccharide biosynthesis predicted glycosyltransferase SpsG
VLSRERPGLLVIDDRVAAATRAWRQSARQLGIPIVSIHDLGLGLGDADLVVDGSVGASKPTGGRALHGPRFAILDPRWVAARHSRRTSTPTRPRVVIALGGGPRVGVALDLARAIRRRDPGTQVLVAAGFSDRRPEALEAGLAWVPSARFTTALAHATVAIVGGGVTLYEACCLGRPTIAVAVAPSQRPAVERFAAHGAAVDGGPIGGTREGGKRTIDALARETARLLADAARQRQLARAARSLVDGRGAVRVAGAIRALLEITARRKAVLR